MSGRISQGIDDLGVTIGGAVAMAGLTAILGANYGATGAGIAFALVLRVTSIVFLIAANRTPNKLITDSPEAL